MTNRASFSGVAIKLSVSEAWWYWGIPEEAFALA